MTDQELRISVARACGFDVILAPDATFPLEAKDSSIIFFPDNDDHGRVVLHIETEYTYPWNPLHDLKLAFECAEKVWAGSGWVFDVQYHRNGEYSCYASDDKVCTAGGAFGNTAEAICQAIHAWRTRSAS